MRTSTDLNTFPEDGETVKVCIGIGCTVRVHKSGPRYDGDESPNATLRVEIHNANMEPVLEKCSGFWRIRTQRKTRNLDTIAGRVHELCNGLTSEDIERIVLEVLDKHVSEDK